MLYIDFSVQYHPTETSGETSARPQYLYLSLDSGFPDRETVRVGNRLHHAEQWNPPRLCAQPIAVYNC